MGAWGTKLYQNDAGNEIKDDYIQKRKAGKTTEEALQEVLEENASYFDDEDDKYDSWFALADTLWKHGVLPEEVKKKVLEIIEEEPQERWETEKQWKAREKVLVDLKQQLLSEMPPVKKVSVHKPYVTKWKPHEVYLYQIKSTPERYKEYLYWYIAIYVHGTGEHEYEVKGVKDVTPYIYLKISKEKPKDVSEINEMDFVCHAKYNTGYGEYRFELAETSNRKFPKDVEYFGVCTNFEYPEHEIISETRKGWIWWNCFVIDAIKGYEENKKK